MSTFEDRVREYVVMRERRWEMVAYLICIPVGIAIVFVAYWLPALPRWPATIAGILLVGYGSVEFIAVGEDVRERVQIAIRAEDRQAEAAETVLLLSVVSRNPGCSAVALAAMGVEGSDLARLAHADMVTYQDGGWHLMGSGDILLGQTCAGDLLEADKGDRAW